MTLTELSWGMVLPWAIWITSLIVLANALIQNAVYVALLAASYVALKRRVPRALESGIWWLLSESALPISILVPAYNESVTIVDNVRSLLALHYPEFELIVVNDGSADETLQVMIEAFDLKPVVRAYDAVVPHRPVRGVYRSTRYPALIVVDKENGGKADALNAGINLARCPLFCSVDADSVLEPDALLRAVQPFIDEPHRVVAVGGTIRIANGCKIRNGRILSIDLPGNLLALFQVVEYLRAFLMARIAWSEINALMLVSGAFGIFRRSLAIAVGGYSHGTVGEDLEIVVKMHRHLRAQDVDYEIRFIPEPVCWTEVPTSLGVLGRQRKRWQRGALETFFKHREMLFNPRYGTVGVLGFANILLVDVLGPVLEVLGYILMPVFYAMGALSLDFFLAYLALAFVFGVFNSVGALVLEEMELKRFSRLRDLLILTVAAVLENFGYRQINNLWRVAGWWQYLRGATGWGQQVRTGFRSG